MTNVFRLSVVLAVPFLLTGCPLTTDYPLAPNTNAPMDQRLLGTWIVEKSSSELELKSAAIFAFNNNEYYVEWLKRGDEEPSRLRAYITNMDNTSFLNVQSIEDDRKFIYCTYTVSSDNTLDIQVVDEMLFPNKPLSSEELNKDISKKLGGTNLYRERVTFKRVNKGTGSQ